MTKKNTKREKIAKKSSEAVFVIKLYQKLTLVFKMKSPAMEPEWYAGPNIPVIFNSIFKKAVILKFV